MADIRDDVACQGGNYPLAGLSLLFEVQIQRIREVTVEEISTGKVF